MEFLKNFDIFASGISLNYRGQEQFKTYWGSFLGVICLSISLPYFYYKAIELHWRENNQIDYY